MANVASKDSNVVDPFINANNVVEINTVPEDKYAGTYFFRFSSILLGLLLSREKIRRVAMKKKKKKT